MCTDGRPDHEVQKGDITLHACPGFHFEVATRAVLVLSLARNPWSHGTLFSQSRRPIVPQ